jgi:hypothetical protein
MITALPELVLVMLCCGDKEIIDATTIHKNKPLTMLNRQTKFTMVLTEGYWRLEHLDLLLIVVIVDISCLNTRLRVLSSLSNKRNNSSNECIVTEQMVGDTIINWVVG